MLFAWTLETWVKDHGEEALLPGLTDYTQSQLCWIRNAQQWCHRYCNGSLRLHMNAIKLGKNNYTPKKYRLIGSLMLSDEFARDFNCPINSTMNPRRNCSIGSLWSQSPINGVKSKNNEKHAKNISEKLNIKVLLLMFVLLKLMIDFWLGCCSLNTMQIYFHYYFC